MKKRVLAIFVVSYMFAMSALWLVGCGSRDEMLKVYNWEDYLAPNVGADFAQYYLEQTGKKIKVEFSSFSTTEEAYTQIKTKKQDYDLVVPSDYMIDRMRKEDLLLPYDKEIVFDGQDIMDVLDNRIVDIVSDSFDPDLEFAVPYLWGTVGILYDPTRGSVRVTEEDASTWETLFGDKYKGQIYMKDSVHDAFAIASIYANYETKLKPALEIGLDEYKRELADIMADTSDDNIARVRDVLAKQKKNLLKYENDDGKDAMAVGSSKAGIAALAWSTDAGFAMNDNSNLRYTVPNEGSNVYIDAMVIPKYAQNVEAANYFLRYLQLADVAFDNMDYTGAPSPVIEAADEYLDYLQDESDLFEDGDDEFKQNYIDMFFASDEILDRTAYFVDFEDRSEIINKMWIGVKSGKGADDVFVGSTGSKVLLVVVGVIIVAALVGKTTNRKRYTKARAS